MLFWVHYYCGFTLVNHGFGSLVVFMFHYIQYFMECELISLHQFEGSHTLGNTYSTALFRCLEISRFKGTDHSS